MWCFCVSPKDDNREELVRKKDVRGGSCKKKKEDRQNLRYWAKYVHSLQLIVYRILTLTIYLCLPPRWGGPPGPGFRLHLRDGVSHKSRERVPQPAARGPQRAAHAEKHAAGDKVSLMDRLIRFCSLTVFIGCHRIYKACLQCRPGGNEIIPYDYSCCWFMENKEC